MVYQVMKSLQIHINMSSYSNINKLYIIVENIVVVELYINEIETKNILLVC